jgi:hypothetical protein
MKASELLVRIGKLRERLEARRGGVDGNAKLDADFKRRVLGEYDEDLATADEMKAAVQKALEKQKPKPKGGSDESGNAD